MILGVTCRELVNCIAQLIKVEDQWDLQFVNTYDQKILNCSLRILRMVLFGKVLFSSVKISYNENHKQAIQVFNTFWAASYSHLCYFYFTIIDSLILFIFHKIKSQYARWLACLLD